MSNLNNNLEVLFNKMENFISTKTVVGEPITIGDIIMLPLVDVSFGVGAGNKESSQDKNTSDAGGGGLGAKITPSAVMVIQNGSVQLINIKNQTSVNKLLDMVPGLVNNFDFASMFKSDKNKDSKAEDTEDK